MERKIETYLYIFEEVARFYQAVKQEFSKIFCRFSRTCKNDEQHSHGANNKDTCICVVCPPWRIESPFLDRGRLDHSLKSIARAKACSSHSSKARFVSVGSVAEWLIQSLSGG